MTSVDGRQPHRPAAFAILFWVIVTVLCAFVVSYLISGRLPVGLLPAIVAGLLALIALWLVLPWDPAASTPRKLLAPTFILVTLAVSLLAGGRLLGLILLIAIANGVFLFGAAWGSAYAGGSMVLMLVSMWALPGRTFEQASLQTVAIVPLCAFTVGVSAALVEARRRREESERLLDELEYTHAELNGYADRVRELTVSEERARMAREMHDSIGHYLTVINVGLENAQRFRTARPDAVWEEVAQAKELTQDALAETRRWVRALKPLALEERAGPDAMAALARSFQGVGPVVGFEVEGTPRDLPGEAELVLYRALQEGLTNALRHSSANRIRASLAFEDAHVRLTVTDDGDGVAAGTTGEVPNGGFGLAALGGRAETVGGTVSAGNAPNGGFVLRVELPVEG